MPIQESLFARFSGLDSVAIGHRRRERAGKKGTGYEWGNALSALDAPFPHSFPVPFLPDLRR
jgi:hypothetical protein